MGKIVRTVVLVLFLGLLCWWMLVESTNDRAPDRAQRAGPDTSNAAESVERKETTAFSHAVLVRVVDATHLGAVAGARVWFDEPTSERSESDVRTTRTGMIALVPPFGGGMLRVSAPGYRDWGELREWSEESRPHVLVVRLAGDGRVRGRVVVRNTDRRPAGVRVRLSSQDPSGSPSYVDHTPAADGSFQFEGLREGARYRLEATAPAYHRTELFPVIARPTPAAVKIQMGEVFGLSVEVRGAGVAESIGELRAVLGRRDEAFQIVPLIWSPQLSGGAANLTIPSGRGPLVVTLQDRFGARLASRTWERGTTSVVRFEVSVVPRSIKVEASEELRKELGTVPIFWRANGTTGFLGLDQHSAFSLLTTAGMQPYDLIAEWGSARGSTLSVPDGDRIEFGPGARAKLIVVGAKGTAVSAQRVLPGGSTVEMDAGGSGTGDRRVFDLPSGTYRLALESEPLPGEIEMDPDSTVTVDLRLLLRGSALHVRLVAPSEPESLAEVRLMTLKRGRLTTVRILNGSADREFRFDGLGAGRYWIQASLPASAVARRIVNVDVADRVAISIERWKRFREYTVAIRNYRDFPLRNVRVVASRMPRGSGVRHTGTTDAAGEFRFRAEEGARVSVSVDFGAWVLNTDEDFRDGRVVLRVDDGSGYLVRVPDTLLARIRRLIAAYRNGTAHWQAANRVTGGFGLPSSRGHPNLFIAQFNDGSVALITEYERESAERASISADLKQTSVSFRVSADTESVERPQPTRVVLAVEAANGVPFGDLPFSSGLLGKGVSLSGNVAILGVGAVQVRAYGFDSVGNLGWLSDPVHVSLGSQRIVVDLKIPR